MNLILKISLRSLRLCVTKTLMLVLFYAFPTCLLKSQEVEKIKVKKEDPFVRADFDETKYKVIAFDKYGNPFEDVVKSFVITFQDTKGNYENAVVGNTFPKNTIHYLTKERKKTTSVCLRKIVAQDADGHIQIIPDKCGILIYPDCKGCKTK